VSDVRPKEIHPPAEQRAEDQAISREVAKRPDCVCTDEHTCSLHYFQQADQARAGDVPDIEDCRLCGPFGRCGYHGGDILHVVGDQVPPGPDVPPGAHSVDHQPTPAEAHEIMQRVTGQPEYPGPAEVGHRYRQDVRDYLAGLRPPVPPFEGWRDAVMMPAPIKPCGCTDTTKCRAHGFPSAAFWNSVATDIKPIELPTPAFVGEQADALSKLIGDAAVEQAKADEQSLRAMGAKGDGRDMLFELDPAPGLFDRSVRLRALARAEGLPQVAVEASVSQVLFERWAPLAEELGKAMMDCAARMRQALVAWEAALDAVKDAPAEEGDPE